MPILVWDNVGDRVYESGLDRGVLYLPDGSAVPWNGLTAVIEQFNKERSPVYYDGMKINDLVVLGDFAASMRAVTYPDEFEELEGLGTLTTGMFVGDQPPQMFSLCYRTQIGNDLDGQNAGYKIHILYNVIAIPKEKTYATISADPSLVEFEWDITAIPEEIPGFRPTAHFIINSLDIEPTLLQELEDMLYGSSSADAALIPISDLVNFITDWFIVKIIDHGDGTWSAVCDRDGYIFMLTEDLFEIMNVNAVYLDDVTFVISDTVSGSAQIEITDLGNGLWTATTDHDNLIQIADDGSFVILNATATYLDEETYQLSNTEV